VTLQAERARHVEYEVLRVYVLIDHDLETIREDPMAVPTQNSSQSRFARPLIALAMCGAIALVLACGSDAPTAPQDVSGTYVLRTVDELALPVTVPNPREHAIVIRSVTATLNENHTYAVAGTGDEDGDAHTVLTDAGTFTQSGSTIHFTSTIFGGATYSGKSKTDTVTVTLPGGFVDSDNASFALLFVKGS